jgi:glycyl-tRNA synthetase
MELEYFVKPGQDEGVLDEWVERYWDWYTGLGLSPDNLRRVEVPDEERAHYSRRTVDVVYQFPFGRGELQGIANRGDYDLSQHSRAAGRELDYFDDETNEHVVPYVIEPSLGVDRAMLVFLLEGYAEEPDKEGIRTVLRLHPRLAPVKVAVLPLVKKDDALVNLAQELYAGLRGEMLVLYDEAGAIGRRYRRQDEIGTPYCLTVDFQSLEDHTVTVRDRDAMTQIRVPMEQLVAWLTEHTR